jgi:hypothetical protein
MSTISTLIRSEAIMHRAPFSPAAVARGLTVLACVSAAPVAAQPGGGGGDDPTCADCVSDTVCAAVSHSGANSCTVSNGKCRMDLSICIIAMEKATEELRLTPEQMLRVRTRLGQLALAPVGESRFAGWDCSGRLVHLVERRPDGRVVALAVQPYLQRYAYSRVRSRAGG